MDASIEEVRSELHLVQNRVRVLHLAIEGIGAEIVGDDDMRSEAIKTATGRCEVVSEILDSLNDDLTLAKSRTP